MDTHPHSTASPQSQPSESPRRVRILIADDDPRVRQGLAATLAASSPGLDASLDVVGEAGNGIEAVERARALGPEVVLMDLEMPVLDGFEATRRIRDFNRPPRVIVLSIHADPAAQERARAAGAAVFVAKGAPWQQVLDAVLGRAGAADSQPMDKGEKS